MKNKHSQVNMTITLVTINASSNKFVTMIDNYFVFLVKDTNIMRAQILGHH